MRGARNSQTLLAGNLKPTVYSVLKISERFITRLTIRETPCERWSMRDVTPAKPSGEAANIYFIATNVHSSSKTASTMSTKSMM